MIRSGLLVPGDHRAAGTDDRAVARAILRTEATWVTAQSEAGLVAPGLARAAEAAVERVPLDETSLTRLAEASEGGGNPVIPLLAAYRAAVADVASEPVTAVHRSLTSQDVMDTALALVLSETREQLLRELARAGDALAGLVERHRATPMVGRTLTQHALPISFGLKASSWLAGVDDAAADARERIRPAVSYGGAAGTLAAGLALCERGRGRQDSLDRLFELLGHWARLLDLELPDRVWHTDRVPVLRTAGALAETTAALGRMANDVLVMSRPEIGELREPTAPGRGVSSAMPQKQNPVLSVLLRRTALAAPSLLAQVTAGAAAAVDERPDGGWHAEWPALRELAALAAASACHAAELAGGLRVDEQRMAENLRRAGPGVLAERLTAELAPVLGQRDGRDAKQRVQAAVRQYPDDWRGLADHLTQLLRAQPDARLPEGVPDDADGVREWLEGLLDPVGYLGAAVELCECAVHHHQELYSTTLKG